MTPPPGPVLPTVEERARVGMMVSRYRRRAANERLNLYRRHLQVTVTAATPLLAMLAADQRVDVRAALHRLRPPHGWPEEPRAGAWFTLSHYLRHRSPDARGDRDRVDPSRTVLVRDHRHPSGSLTLNLSGGAVEMTLRIGQVIVRTVDGFVELVLGFELPETIELAIVGRPVRQLVGHPWFEDERWLVDRVVRGGGGLHRRTTVTVATGHEPFAMPWRRLLERDARARG